MSIDTFWLLPGAYFILALGTNLFRHISQRDQTSLPLRQLVYFI